MSIPSSRLTAITKPACARSCAARARGTLRPRPRASTRHSKQDVTPLWWVACGKSRKVLLMLNHDYPTRAAGNDPESNRLPGRGAPSRSRRGAFGRRLLAGHRGAYRGHTPSGAKAVRHAAKNDRGRAPLGSPFRPPLPPPPKTEGPRLARVTPLSIRPSKNETLRPSIRGRYAYSREAADTPVKPRSELVQLCARISSGNCGGCSPDF